ncbi:hypothetical protein K435DRAFT_460876 [Dendrothele bispora CBS 962.96]|uniref:Uncharacterized protein n=1 Tax=Dendrothele bispora (strain CBS 962.96) TaxID=1314807 RepID=A0A4S8L1Q3_DENBC|nr:hypothetical protein K435DRAFT_460876 [Dendrothele bispora CBS 962.96]
MITGPALCLFFAALRCTTNPPSVPLPRRRKNSNGTSTVSTPTDLSTENCPPAFRSFLSVWARCVPPIQALTPEHQHDLARIICGLDPLTVTLSEDVYGIAADLRAVAIEISQRRSFQDRYASDLQAALDSSVGASPGNGGGGVSLASSSNPSPSFKASFVPPPSYEDVQHNSPSPSPTSSACSSAQSSPNAQVINLPPQGQLPPQDTTHLSPFSPTFAPPVSGPSSESGSGGRTTNSSPSRPHSIRVSVAFTASSATLTNDSSPSSPPFPQIPIGSHGTYHPPHIPPPGPHTNNSDALPPPPLPPKSECPGYIDAEEERGYGQGQGYYKPNNTTTNANTTKPLKLQKSRRCIDSHSSSRVVEVRSA